MTWLPDGQKSFKIGLVVLVQYRDLLLSQAKVLMAGCQNNAADQHQCGHALLLPRCLERDQQRDHADHHYVGCQ